MSDGLVELSLSAESKAQVIMCVEKIRTNSDRLAVKDQGVIQLPRVFQGLSQGKITTGLFWIARQACLKHRDSFVWITNLNQSIANSKLQVGITWHQLECRLQLIQCFRRGLFPDRNPQVQARERIVLSHRQR